MPADILTLHSVPPSQALTSPVPMAQEEELAGLECLHQELLCRGLPDNEARTEVARIAARKVWDGFAAQLRRHRAAGRQVDANVPAVALGSMQGMTFPLLRHRGDVDFERHSTFERLSTTGSACSTPAEVPAIPDPGMGIGRR